VAHSREDEVGGMTGAAFEEAASEMTFGLQVADDGLDGGAAAQLAHFRRRLLDGTVGIWRPPMSRSRIALERSSAVVSTWDGFGLFDARGDRYNCAASGRKVPLVIKPRRAGDPPFLVANPSAARSTLGFRPVVAEAPAVRQGEGIEELSRPNRHLCAAPRE
jgi:hypothetical protein